MKTIAFILKLVLCFIYTGAIHTQNLPYFQPFENNSFLNDSRIFMGGVTDIQNPFGCSGCSDCPWDNLGNIITSAEGYSWEISDNYQLHQNSLRLTVHPQDHPQCAYKPRSRSELTLKLFNEFNKNYYYSWKVYIPNDFEFSDNLDPSSQWHIISQIKTDKLNDTNYADRLILTANYKYKPEDILGLLPRDLILVLFDADNPNVKHSEIRIENAIKKGEWSEIIYKINWNNQNFSIDSLDGFIELWINRKPLIKYHTIYDSLGRPIHFGILDNQNNIPTKFYFPNIYFTEGGFSFPVCSFMKLGHYRGGGDEPAEVNHTLYIDDYRITEEFPPPLNKTKLIYGICDTTLHANDLKISCYEIAGANNYKFRIQYIENGITETRWIDSPISTVNLANYNFIKPGKSYNVIVRAQKLDGGNVIWENDYYESCQITIPLDAITNFTKIISSQCNQTIPQNVFLECYSVQGTTNYKFRFERNNQYFWVDSPTNVINLNNHSFIQPGNTYNISVRVQGPYFDNDYGEECFINISTPSIIHKSNETINSGKIYPNPFKHQVNINIQGEESINFIKLYSTNGKLLYELSQPVNNSVDLSFLDNGFYFLEINYDGSNIREFFKILKK